MEDWVSYSDRIYGLGQRASHHVHSVPDSSVGTPPPSSSTPQPAEVLTFSIVAFDDGSAVVSWQGVGGNLHKSYLSTFDLRYQGNVMSDVFGKTITPGSPDLPYQLFLMVSSAPKDSAVVNIQAGPEQTPHLARLTGRYQEIYDSLSDRVDLRVANSDLPPRPVSIFDDRGNPLKQFFRVEVSSIDSNFDGVNDEDQFGAGDPFDMDIDNDGIPNGYDRNFWIDRENEETGPQYSETIDLLGNLLINEAMFSNEFTNVDDDLDCNDWIELFNPTDQSINLGDWYLSSDDNDPRQWKFPPGTHIGSGQFLVIWASGKSRGGTEGDYNNDGILQPYSEDFENHGAPNGDLDPGEDRNGDGILAILGEDLPNNGVPNGIIDPPQAIHTNFRLSPGDFLEVPQKQPENLYLVSMASGSAVVIDKYRTGGGSPTINFGPQRTDVSFGRYPSPEGLKTGYMTLPTPGLVAPLAGGGDLGPSGQHNAAGALGFTDPPVFAPGSDLPGLYENTTVTAHIIPPASGGTIHFTTNSAHPSRYSELYSGPITTDRTRVIRAIASRKGYLPSPGITRSFLFKEDILGTANPGTLPLDQQGALSADGEMIGLLRGYPEETEVTGFPIRYEMHPGVIRDHRAEISAGLDAIPVVSLVSDVALLFDHDTAGLYPNSGKTDGHLADRVPEADPRGRAWQRLCSFEFIKSGQGTPGFVQANACLAITGGSSIYQDITGKHNLRVRFHSSHGPDELNYRLFDDFTGIRFSDFHLKNPTHDSWVHLLEEGDKNQADQASYCDEGWVREAHRKMGHLNPHRRWVQLFLNGVYWGLYELTERVNDEFMRRNEGSGKDATYDVIKQKGKGDPDNSYGVHAVDGNTHAWEQLVEECQDLSELVAIGADDTLEMEAQDDSYASIEGLIDIENYIDYLLCNSFAHGTDWVRSNFRAARRSDAGDPRFRFYVWDAELSFQPGSFVENGAELLDDDGVASLHTRLSSYIGYRQAFAERIRFHFHPHPGEILSGTLAITSAGDRAIQLYQDEMSKFRPLLHGESARWGYLRPRQPEADPYTFEDPGYLPNDVTKGDWKTTTDYVTGTWIPDRRNYFFRDFADAGLYVVLEDSPPSGQVGTSYTHSFTATGGTSPHTTTLFSGSLPPGLSLNNQTLSGLPATAGTYTFTLATISSDVLHNSPRPLTGLSRFTLVINP